MGVFWCQISSPASDDHFYQASTIEFFLQFFANLSNGWQTAPTCLHGARTTHAVTFALAYHVIQENLRDNLLLGWGLFGV